VQDLFLDMAKLIFLWTTIWALYLQKTEGQNSIQLLLGYHF